MCGYNKERNASQLLEWTASLLNEKIILFMFIPSNPKNSTFKVNSINYHDTVIMCFVINILEAMILMEMAMLLAKKPKNEKEEKMILSYLRVYSALTLSQRRLDKIFWFWMR